MASTVAYSAWCELLEIREDILTNTDRLLSCRKSMRFRVHSRENNNVSKAHDHPCAKLLYTTALDYQSRGF